MVAPFLLLVTALPVFLSPTLLCAEPMPPQNGLYAWYTEDGIQAESSSVTSWNCKSNNQALALNRIVGKPRLFRISTPNGIKNIVRLKRAALWQTVESWGTLRNAKTIFIYTRVSGKNEGVLFDGSTRKGMLPCRRKSDQWEVSGRVTTSPKVNRWQCQGFLFDSKASPLGGFIIGANVATEEKLECDIAEILVYSRMLDESEVRQVEKYLEAKWGEPQDLPESEQPSSSSDAIDPSVYRKILRQAGDEDVHTYRIPGLATTEQGTLIAVFDARNKSGGDLPGDIDVAMMRSTDNGNTWSPMKRIIDFDAAVPGSYGNGVGDPAVLVDRKTGTIFVAALWSQGKRAWHGSGPGLTPEETGQLVIVKSNDDGITWSAPINITQQIKQPEWRLCFNGPGNGIQLTDNTLVFPAQFRDKTGMPHSCFIASRDGGENWQISPPAIPAAIPTSESAVVQLADGSLLLSMRNESRAGLRAWARWEWKDTLMQGAWSEPWYAAADPTCMASLIQLPTGDLLFSNPNDAQKRVNLTVRRSSDGGRSWDTGRVVDAGGAMYSCMTVLRDGRIGILYESDEAEGLVFVRLER
jgi:sialidase-1